MSTDDNPFAEGDQKPASRIDYYSRCWEISMYHLPPPVMQFLEYLADQRVPTGLLFEPFRLPHGTGCRLLCTPWTGTPFESIYADQPQTLRQVQLSAGMPEVLVGLLHLAAEANTRILILDPDAPELDGLVSYRGQWQ